MFESIKHWFESLDNAESHFDHPDDEMLHGALASVLMHIIHADNIESSNEKNKFFDIMQSEFRLDNEKINYLYRAAKASTVEVKDDMLIIKQFLKDNPVVKMQFFDQLNQLVDLNGVQENELKVFYQALYEVFPELNNPA